MEFKHSRYSEAGGLITIDGVKPDTNLVYRRGSGFTVEIYNISVTTERRKGVGRALIKELINITPSHIKKIFAITRAENLIAQKFYEGIGFHIIAHLNNFYRDGENPKPGVDAIMYGLDINKE